MGLTPVRTQTRNDVYIKKLTVRGSIYPNDNDRIAPAYADFTPPAQTQFAKWDTLRRIGLMNALIKSSTVDSSKANVIYKNMNSRDKNVKKNYPSDA